jgi:hypothetical protein
MPNNQQEPGHVRRRQPGRALRPGMQPTDSARPPAETGTVARAIAVLRAVAESGGGTQIKRVSAQLQLPAPTVHRLLDLLMRYAWPGNVRELTAHGTASGERERRRERSTSRGSNRSPFSSPLSSTEKCDNLETAVPAVFHPARMAGSPPRADRASP